MNLGICFGEDLDFTSCQSRLAAKFAIYGSIDLVKDMATDTKRKIRPNILVFPPPLLYLYLNCLLLLIPEMKMFVYYGIRQDCEGISCSSQLVKASVSEFRLISVGSCTLLKCITWLLSPVWWVNYPVEGLGDYELDYFTCKYVGSSVMLLVDAFR